MASDSWSSDVDSSTEDKLLDSEDDNVLDLGAEEQIDDSLLIDDHSVPQSSSPIKSPKATVLIEQPVKKKIQLRRHRPVIQVTPREQTERPKFFRKRKSFAHQPQDNITNRGYSPHNNRHNYSNNNRKYNHNFAQINRPNNSICPWENGVVPGTTPMQQVLTPPMKMKVPNTYVSPLLNMQSTNENYRPSPKRIFAESPEPVEERIYMELVEQQKKVREQLVLYKEKKRELLRTMLLSESEGRNESHNNLNPNFYQNQPNNSNLKQKFNNQQYYNSFPQQQQHTFSDTSHQNQQSQQRFTKVNNQHRYFNQQSNMPQKAVMDQKPEKRRIIPQQMPGFFNATIVKRVDQ